MTLLPYDPNVKNSIIDYAKKLKGQSLRTACPTILNHGFTGKGSFGQLLEKFYFQYEPNSESEPDFPIANIELKSSPLKKLKSQEYRSKERLVLSIINYHELILQDFENSSFWKKNSSLLMVFYLHQADANVLDYVIKIADEWNFPSIDLEIIKKDWHFIKAKIEAGKAHELSEGDTYYLGACTKGAKGGNYRTQPNNTLLAKQRAFSLKQGYVNHIIATLSDNMSEVYGKLLPNLQEAQTVNIEDKVKQKFAPFIGLSDKDLANLFKINIKPETKQYHSKISKAIINSVFDVPEGKAVDEYIEEFSKAEIIVRTVRLDEKDTPEEDVSFPTFKYEELIKEAWEDSQFKSLLEHKFLFVFFQKRGEGLFLRQVKFWNMPYDDIVQAKPVWDRTKLIVESGDIVKAIQMDKSGKKIRKTNFPGRKFNHIAHVRPHAQDATDTYPLPTQDNCTKLIEYTKHCFWLNKSYIKNTIYLG